MPLPHSCGLQARNQPRQLRVDRLHEVLDVFRLRVRRVARAAPRVADVLQVQAEQPRVVFRQVPQPVVDHHLVGQLVGAVIQKVGVLEDRVVVRSAGEDRLDAGAPGAQKNIVDVVRLEEVRARVHRDVRARAASPRARPIGQVEPWRGARAVVRVGRDALLQQRPERRRAIRDRRTHAVVVDAVDDELNDDGIGDLRRRAALGDERRRRTEQHCGNDNGRNSHARILALVPEIISPVLSRHRDTETQRHRECTAPSTFAPTARVQGTKRANTRAVHSRRSCICPLRSLHRRPLRGRQKSTWTPCLRDSVLNRLRDSAPQRHGIAVTKKRVRGLRPSPLRVFVLRGSFFVTRG